MKAKSTYIILIIIIICSFLTIVRLLYLNKQNTIKMETVLKNDGN
jgi:hypothetical protein